MNIPVTYQFLPAVPLTVRLATIPAPTVRRVKKPRAPRYRRGGEMVLRQQFSRRLPALAVERSAA